MPIKCLIKGENVQGNGTKPDLKTSGLGPGLDTGLCFHSVAYSARERTVQKQKTYLWLIHS